MNDSELHWFNQWALWSREERAISDPYEKRATEYAKASIEFAKLIITNLHLINAGGLLATPTIATFLNFTKAPDTERFYLIAVPASLFAAGLLMAAFCAFITYLNYQYLAMHERASQWNAVMGTEALFPLFQKEPRNSERKTEMAANAALIQSTGWKIGISYWGALIAGWLSAGCFLASCIFMAVKMR